jgi:hypothetical protein
MKTGVLKALPRSVADGEAKLGPAVVVSAGPSVVTVALADGREVRATMALALPYAAEPGDVLLVIGQGAEHYVIGVLSGKGKTAVELQGDVSIRAVGGTLDLSGDKGVRLTGPLLSVSADAVRTVARSVVATCETWLQRATEALHVHARQSITQVDEGAYTQAKTAAIQTEDTVTINGKEIHLA